MPATGIFGSKPMMSGGDGALIIASGASARYLGLENEQKLVGHGLTSCANATARFTKTLRLRRWRGRFCSGGIIVPHPLRFKGLFDSSTDKMRASKIMAGSRVCEQESNRSGIPSLPEYIPDEKGEMRAVRLRNVQTNEERELAVPAFSWQLVTIQHQGVSRKLDMDGEGYLITKKLVEGRHPACRCGRPWPIAFTNRP